MNNFLWWILKTLSREIRIYGYHLTRHSQTDNRRATIFFITFFFSGCSLFLKGIICPKLFSSKIFLVVISPDQNQNQISLLVTHQLIYIHQVQRMRGLFSRSHHWCESRDAILWYKPRYENTCIRVSRNMWALQSLCVRSLWLLLYESLRSIQISCEHKILSRLRGGAGRSEPSLNSDFMKQRFSRRVSCTKLKLSMYIPGAGCFSVRVRVFIWRL